MEWLWIVSLFCKYLVKTPKKQSFNKAFACYSGTNVYFESLRYEEFNGLKIKKPELKTLLAIGGATFDLRKMTLMLSTTTNRKTFIDNSINYLREWGFNGFDLDFEYPGSHESPAGDKERFTLLVQVIYVVASSNY